MMSETDPVVLVLKTQHAEVDNVEDAKRPSGPSGLAQETSTLSPEERTAEKRFLLKVDCIILPLLSLMYFLASLDRGDIGNAAVAGMTKDLMLTPQQYSNCVSLFYLGYILFELPGTIFLRKISPPVQLGVAMMAWGTFTALISTAKSWGVIASLRVLIGCCEAFLQAAPLYLTFWYKRDQLAKRGSIFFSVIAIAGSMNGVIAYGIQMNINGDRGWPAWRWIFFIEGIISIFGGFIVWGLLPPVPEKMRWGFSPQEKAIAVRRTREAFNVPHAKLNGTQLKAVLKDPKMYFYVVTYGCMNISLASFGAFLPVLLKSFGYSALKTQLYTIPIYIVVAASILAFDFLSDSFKKRGLFLILCYSIAGLGWLLLLVGKSRQLSFAACFLIGLGTYPQVVLIQTWMNSNVLGFTKRAGSLAFIMVVGQSMALAGTEVYSDPPHYYRGSGFALGAMVIGFLTTVLLMIFLARKNADKIAAQDSDEAIARRGLGLEEIWDDHPDFFYYL